MARIVLGRGLIDRSTLTAIMASVAVVALHVNPRIALSDYPDDVKAAVSPRTMR